jgi:Domain of unknown function (DUF1929)
MLRTRTVGAGVFAALAVACAVPATAPADHPLYTAEGHVEEDTVVLTRSMETRFEQRTEAATRSDAQAAAAAVVGDEHEVGQWGPVIDWPVVGIHMALLSNGKVLAYDSSADALGVEDHSFTRATVWDPESDLHTDAMLTGFNIFCSGLAHLMDGTLFTAGGNKNDELDGIRNTYTFEQETATWTRGADMAEERWYPSVTPLNDGEMLVTDGIDDAPDSPEVRKTDGTFRSLSTAAKDLPLYPWMDVAPDGRTFYSGPTTTMRYLDTTGTGSWIGAGQRDTVARSYGSHALYDVGKILVAGGGPSTPTATTIDLNGSVPVAEPTDPMETGRRQHNLTVLADGTVLATGGNSSGESLVDMENGVYTAELWDPDTGDWTTLDSMQMTRQYHSSAMLLPDGRVLSAGGGICGDCNRAGYLNRNAEVFTPPYLFKSDGSGELAPRPEITSAPAVVNYGAQFSVGTPQAGSIGKVAMMRLGAVTHSVNMEQRYVPLSYSAGGGGITATAPSNPNIAPPGVYMLFILDSNGVPSVAEMVRIEPGAGPLAPTINDTDPNSPSKDNAPEVSGTGAAAGSTVRIYGNATCSGPVLGSGSATVFNGPSGITTNVPADVTTNLRATVTVGGQTSPCSAPFAYTEDSTAPGAIITESPPARTTDTTVTLAFTSTEPGSTFDCRMDGAVFAPCSSPVQQTVSLGKHVFRVRATDVSKNRGAPVQVSFRVVD